MQNREREACMIERKEKGEDYCNELNEKMLSKRIYENNYL